MVRTPMLVLNHCGMKVGGKMVVCGTGFVVWVLCGTPWKGIDSDHLDLVVFYGGTMV